MNKVSDADLTAETGHKDRCWKIKSDPRQRITRQIQDSLVKTQRGTSDSWKEGHRLEADSGNVTLWSLALEN